jgi:hypothetical protein
MRIEGTAVRASTLAGAVVIVLTGATGAGAQAVQSVGSAVPADQMSARFKIAAMEAVLERAVQLGAQRLSQQVQAVSTDVLFIATAARARGFWLDGYGVFFDVDVPAMRHSMAWTVRQLDRGSMKLQADVETLRRNAALVHDPQARKEMEAALQRMERLFGPGPALPPGMDPNAVAGAPTMTAARAPLPAGASPGEGVLDDPGLAYTNEVKSALVDAMMDYGGSIPVAESEWLTIAARDNNDSRIGGEDPYDVTTIILRIRGSDLAAFRAGRITRDEAIKKVNIREF